MAPSCIQYQELRQCSLLSARQMCHAAGLLRCVPNTPQASAHMASGHNTSNVTTNQQVAAPSHDAIHPTTARPHPQIMRHPAITLG